MLRHASAISESVTKFENGSPAATETSKPFSNTQRIIFQKVINKLYRV